jgi:3'-5' exoribonuclease
MDIDALVPGGLITDEVLLVAACQLGVDKRGQNYYTLKLNAEGGRAIEGKVWGDNIAGAIAAGQGLEVLARVDEYRGKKQLNIQRYRVLAPEDFDLSGHVRSTDIDVDAAFETLFDWSERSEANPWYCRLMDHLHDPESSFARHFKLSPAATFHHHNYQGGLIEHTLEVRNLAAAVADQCGDKLDMDLLLCGAAVHDIGKMHSYRLNAGISESTVNGQMLDHLFIGASMLSNIWDKHILPHVAQERAADAAEAKAMLLHLVLSHHGKREWGSPVIPRTPEAVLLHHADVISANMYACLTAVDDTPDGETWSDNVYIMDQKRKMFVQKKNKGTQT